jgi:hypothetical protein
MKPDNINYASGPTRSKLSPAMRILHTISATVCLPVGTLLALVVFLAFGFHASDPADPNKVAPVALATAVFLGLGIWSAYQLRRR